MQNVAAEFSIGQRTPINAEFSVEPTQAIDTVFQLDTAFNVVGEGLIDAVKNGDTFIITSKTYIHEQGLASDSWEINHNLNLNKIPSVTVIDSAGQVQIPNDIIYNNSNTITITFLAAFAGKVFLN